MDIDELDKLAGSIPVSFRIKPSTKAIIIEAAKLRGYSFAKFCKYLIENDLEKLSNVSFTNNTTELEDEIKKLKKNNETIKHLTQKENYNEIYTLNIKYNSSQSLLLEVLAERDRLHGRQENLEKEIVTRDREIERLKKIIFKR